MARNKNAKRKHEIAPWDPKNPTTEPESGAWKPLLAKAGASRVPCYFVSSVSNFGRTQPQLFFSVI